MKPSFVFYLAKLSFAQVPPTPSSLARTRDLISMTAQSQQDHEAIIIKTQEQKNIRIQTMSIRQLVQKPASAHISECPSWQKNCSTKHSILKRGKRKNLLFFITKGSRRHRPQVRNIDYGMCRKFICKNIQESMVSFCSYVLLSEKLTVNTH